MAPNVGQDVRRKDQVGGWTRFPEGCSVGTTFVQGGPTLSEGCWIRESQTTPKRGLNFRPAHMTVSAEPPVHSAKTAELCINYAFSRKRIPRVFQCLCDVLFTLRDFCTFKL
ncbi:hypothetical protein DPMN_067000 [Dreissena polymorpha]|uniref:Uncharacterized protein n=1 Tax=Dreissena polymorpha TaxID=45954 RepID=A0A9D3YYY2_DREPO|nr:hypothetical protein DPMN_067000 [Dreissena polymorpha]